MQSYYNYVHVIIINGPRGFRSIQLLIMDTQHGLFEITWKDLTDNQAGRQDCAGDELCQRETGGSGYSCETENSGCVGSQPSQPIDRLLHNIVSQSNIYTE